jgi:hypothetical protein
MLQQREILAGNNTLYLGSQLSCLSNKPKCVVRVFYKDAVYLCKEFGKEDELETIVKKQDQYTLISLTGTLWLAKVFSNYNWRLKRTTHTYYLYGVDRSEVTTILSSTCGKRVRGCFVPIPQL